MIKRIKGINLIESIDSIEVHENELILSKGKKKIILNLMDKKGYLNNTYHKPDCIICVFNCENEKYYDYMKLCKYYIKNYDLNYLFGINFNKYNNKNYIKNYIEKDAKQFAYSNNLKFICIYEDNENYIKNFLNYLIIELEKNNQENINIMKEIPPKEYRILLLGDCAIGAKTSLAARLSYGYFHK